MNEDVKTVLLTAGALVLGLIVFEVVKTVFADQLAKLPKV